MQNVMGHTRVEASEIEWAGADDPVPCVVDSLVRHMRAQGIAWGAGGGIDSSLCRTQCTALTGRQTGGSATHRHGGSCGRLGMGTENKPRHGGGRAYGGGGGVSIEPPG